MKLWIRNADDLYLSARPDSSRLTLIAVANLTLSERNTGTNFASSGTGLYSAYRLDDAGNVQFEVALDTMGAPYRYFFYQNNQRSDQSYDWEALVDEATLSFFGFRLGKQRFQLEGTNPIPFAENELILQDVHFARMGLSWRKNSADGLSFFHAGIFESRDGEFDMDLKSEGLMVGAQTQLQITEKLKARGAYVYDEFGRNGEARQLKVGADYDATEWMTLWASGYSLDNDPFGNESKWAAEGGFICRINEFYSTGLTLTCEDQDQTQLILHGQYTSEMGMIFKIWAGGLQVDRSYVNAGFADRELGWTVGTSVDLTMPLAGALRGVKKLFSP